MEAFDEFDDEVKCHILKEHARFLWSVPFEAYIVMLYSWDHFFIEAYYDCCTDQFVRIIIADENKMKKHLDRISLLDLYDIPGVDNYYDLQLG